MDIMTMLTGRIHDRIFDVLDILVSFIRLIDLLIPVMKHGSDKFVSFSY